MKATHIFGDGSGKNLAGRKGDRSIRLARASPRSDSGAVSISPPMMSARDGIFTGFKIRTE
jgi:hypothetical protein